MAFLVEITDLPSLPLAEMTDLLHFKKGNTDYKATLSQLIQPHVNTPNPHNITKSVIGLSQLSDDAQLKIASNLADLANASTARTNLGVLSTTETQAAIDVHSDLQNNPHNVTKSQVGLDSVNNFPVSHNPFDNSTVKYASINAVSKTQAQLTQDVLPNLVPVGLISLWSGDILSLPAGWVLCNGANNTPNLQNKFVRGATVGTQNTSGGADSVTHSHGGNVQPHALTRSQIPPHQHDSGWGEHANLGSPYGFFTPAGGNNLGSSGSNFDNSRFLTGNGSAESGLSGSSHTHGLTITSQNISILPSYFALAYIMFIGS